MFIQSWVNRAISRVLEGDEEALAKLKPLHGSNLVVSCLAPFIPVIVCRASCEGLEVTFGDPEQSDVRVTGSPWQLALAMLQHLDEQGAPMRSDITIEGDVTCLQAWIRYFAALDIDVEELLSRYVGDVPAHYAAEWQTRIQTFLRRRKETAAISIQDYLHEESALLVPHQEIQDYLQKVDVLSHDVARLEARVLQLIAKWKGVL